MFECVFGKECRNSSVVDLEKKLDSLSRGIAELYAIRDDIWDLKKLIHTMKDNQKPKTKTKKEA